MLCHQCENRKPAKQFTLIKRYRIDHLILSTQVDICHVFNMVHTKKEKLLKSKSLMQILSENSHSCLFKDSNSRVARLLKLQSKEQMSGKTDIYDVYNLVKGSREQFLYFGVIFFHQQALISF